MEQTSLVLRDYQQEMLVQLADAWQQHRSVMVQMPTGTGKTVLLAETIFKVKSEKLKVKIGSGSEVKSEKLKVKISSDHQAEAELLECETVKPQNRKTVISVLVVAHRRELIEQIRNTIAAFGMAQDAVRVESIQKLSRHIDEVEYEPMLVIVDEAHHALAKTYRLLWERWPEARFLGLTATPCRLGGEAFTDLFDVLLESWSIQTFIDKGWLSDFEYVSARPDSEMMRRVRSLKKRGADGDYQPKEMAAVMDVPESVRHLYLTYRQFAEGKKGIVYAIDRRHALHIADFYQRQGVSCCVIDSKTPAAERDLLVRDYQADRLKVLVNVDIFSEGFDCPEVEFIQLARPTLSLAKYLQQVGRGMRVSKGKPHVLILDNVGLYQTFGLPTEARDWQRMFQGKDAGKGNTEKTRCILIDDTGKEKELINLQMVRIKTAGRRHTGLEVFLQGGRYGVMRNGRVTCPASFQRVERLEKGCGFFAIGTYRRLSQYNHGKLIDVTTVIDKWGCDLGVKLYGKVRWTGSYFIGEYISGDYRSVNCWDPVGNSYYIDMVPSFSMMGGVEVALANEHNSIHSSCLKLRVSTGKVSPRFDWQEMFYNRDIVIARDYLVVKHDNNHAYKICGYLDSSVLVQNEDQHGFLQVFKNGKKGKLFPHLPQGATPILMPNRLELKRVEQ